MDLLNLVAKMTLDASEYEKQLADLVATQTPVPPITVTPIWDESEYNKFIEQTQKAGTVTPTIDTKEYEKSLDEAEGKTSVFGQIVSNVWNEIKGVVLAAGVSWAVTKVVDTLSEGVSLARQLGDNIDKSSKAMGISAQAYQEWDHVLKLNGASVTTLNQGLMNMKKFTQGGKLSDDVSGAFEKLHISAENANGSIKSTEQILSETISALADYTGQDRDILTNAIFGRSGDRLNAMLDGTSSDIDALIKQAHELGLVMTDDEVKNAVAYNDAVSNMQASIDAFKTSLVVDLMPVLTDVANKVASVVAFFNPRTKQESLLENWAGDDKELAAQLQTIEESSVAAQSLADKLLAMGDTSKMTADQYALWEETANRLIEIVPSLGDVIDTETGKIDGNSDSIRANIQEWEKLSKQKAVQALKEEKYNEYLKANKDAINAQADAIAAASIADGKRATAISELNTALKNYGLEQIGENASFEEFLNARTNLQNMFADDTNRLKEYYAAGDIGKEYVKLEEDARKAQVEAEKTAGDLETAKTKLDEWNAAIDEMFGTTEESASGVGEQIGKIGAALNALPDSKDIVLNLITNGEVGEGFAKGSWNVPYDMPAYLHSGEIVLTKSQARKYREGGGNDSSAVVAAIQSMRNDLQNMKLIVGQRVFGRTVVDYGGNRMNDYIGEADSRAAAGYGA